MTRQVESNTVIHTRYSPAFRKEALALAERVGVERATKELAHHWPGQAHPSCLRPPDA